MSPLLAAGVGVQPGIGVGNGPPSQPDIPPVLSSLAVGSPLDDSPGSVVAVVAEVTGSSVLDALALELPLPLALALPLPLPLALAVLSPFVVSLPSVVPIVSTSEGPT